ncbi:hypothetical protein BV898_08293 [Hypsibius exemplaris]|uniref:Uncharacterized protein n=1 Tax=Hypsibius exemplaris TaxID=2072580 RepID=A0A1W0WR40_HYPEX|nr:hypothetical protein BV898_08293 [Hypsibius exemplaris]
MATSPLPAKKCCLRSWTEEMEMRQKAVEKRTHAVAKKAELGKRQRNTWNRLKRPKNTAYSQDKVFHLRGFFWTYLHQIIYDGREAEEHVDYWSSSKNFCPMSSTQVPFGKRSLLNEPISIDSVDSDCLFLELPMPSSGRTPRSNWIGWRSTLVNSPKCFKDYRGPLWEIVLRNRRGFWHVNANVSHLPNLNYSALQGDDLMRVARCLLDYSNVEGEVGVFSAAASYSSTALCRLKLLIVHVYPLRATTTNRSRILP